MSGQVSPEIIQQALTSVDTVIKANEELSRTTADLTAATYLQTIVGVKFADGSMDVLCGARERARAGFILADSMVPNLRDESLTSHPDFTLISHPEQAETTVDHSELKEALTGTFESAFASYKFALDTKNEGKRGKNKISPVGEAEAREGLEARLTPQLLQKLADEREAYNAQKTETDLEWGYRVEIVADEDFTEEEETAIADALQTTIQEVVLDVSWEGDAFLDTGCHNAETSNKAQSGDHKVRYVLTPNHFNVPAGKAKVQKEWLEAQNANGIVIMRSPNDLEAMQDIHALATTDELTDPDTRFNKTYSRVVEDYEEDANGAPVGSGVPGRYVGGDGRFIRVRTRVDIGYPGRALVVLT